MTWWSWCWRSLYLRSLTVNVTCCCARLGCYWVCLTVTSLCERSVRLMSTVLVWSSWCQAVQGALLCLATALHSAYATSCANRRMTFSFTRHDGWIQSSASWTAPVMASVTRSHGAVSATLSGWRTSSELNLVTQRATVSGVYSMWL